MGAHIFNLGVKELRSLWRDRMLLIFIAYAFTLAIYAAATAMPETLNKTSVAIVDEDGSPLSARIADGLLPPYFLPPVMIGPEEMDQRMDLGEDVFALDLPVDFQRDLLAGHVPVVQLNVDATRMTQAFAGSGYIQQIVTDEVRAFVARYRSVASLLVELTLRARFNPDLTKSWFGSVMEVINNITMLSIVLTGAALLREREHGTIEHLLVMPVTPFEIMAAKVWSMAVVVLLATAVAIFFVVQGLLAVPIQGSVALFLLGATLHLFATTSLGIFLGTFARSMPQFALLLILVLLPLEMLSGGMTPRESMPAAVRELMLLAPTTHFVTLAQAILYRGAGLAVVWPQFLAIAGIGAAFFTIAHARFRRTIGRMT